MIDWKSLLNEKVDKKHRESVLKSAKPLIDEYRAESSSRRSFVLGILGVSLAGIAAVVAFVKFSSENAPSSEVGMFALDDEILVDGELLEDLAVLEDLEELETLNEEEDV